VLVLSQPGPTGAGVTHRGILVPRFTADGMVAGSRDGRRSLVTLRRAYPLLRHAPLGGADSVLRAREVTVRNFRATYEVKPIFRHVPTRHLIFEGRNSWQSSFGSGVPFLTVKDVYHQTR
jgi:hypothetical protein